MKRAAWQSSDPSNRSTDVWYSQSRQNEAILPAGYADRKYFTAWRYLIERAD